MKNLDLLPFLSRFKALFKSLRFFKPKKYNYKRFSLADYDEEFDVFRLYQHYFYWFFILIILYLLYHFLLKATIDTYFLRQEFRHTLYNQNLLLSKQHREKVEVEQQVIDELEEEIKKFSQKFFLESEFIEFYIHKVPFLVESQGCLIDFVSILPARNIDNKFAYYALLLNIRGPFFDVVRLLEKFETYEPALKINEFSMSHIKHENLNYVFLDLNLQGYGLL